MCDTTYRLIICSPPFHGLAPSTYSASAWYSDKFMSHFCNIIQQYHHLLKRVPFIYSSDELHGCFWWNERRRWSASNNRDESDGWKDRNETEEEKKQEKTHLLLPESFPQPLKAGGIKVKMLVKTKGEERKREVRRGGEERRGDIKLWADQVAKSCLWYLML